VQEKRPPIDSEPSLAKKESKKLIVKPPSRRTNTRILSGHSRRDSEHNLIQKIDDDLMFNDSGHEFSENSMTKKDQFGGGKKNHGSRFQDLFELQHDAIDTQNNLQRINQTTEAQFFGSQIQG